MKIAVLVFLLISACVNFVMNIYIIDEVRGETHWTDYAALVWSALELFAITYVCRNWI